MNAAGKLLLKYRSDIDGLRAIAVLPVVLFHADLTAFSGGYVGVDIFFVISGFLITGIISREIQNGDFSIITFYERRVRRIFPALFVMFFFTLAAGVFLLLPSDLEKLGASVVAATTFVSNIFFLRTSGYFERTAELNPLLHTWSLAIEEQYYLFFPILLMVLWKFRWNWKVVTSAGLVLSFVYSIYMTDHYTSKAFYLLPSRAWELLLGSIIALGVLPRINNTLLLEILAALGIGFIAFAVLVYDPETIFPGLAALLPCLGAGLLIFTGQGDYKTTVARILSGRVLVFFGLISYSLYLWHWPIFVFTNYYSVFPLPLAHSLLNVIISVFIAYLSWQFIENPFRKPGGKFYSNQKIVLFSTTAVTMVGLVVMGTAFWKSEGIQFRSVDPIIALIQNVQKASWEEREMPFWIKVHSA